MTRGWRLAGLTVIVGLAAVCLVFAWNVITARPPSVRGGNPPRMQISSIDLATGDRYAAISADSMVPGVDVTAAVTVVNSGREPTTYVMSRGPVSADGAELSAALLLTIRTVGSSCADFDGSILFDGHLDDAAIGSDGDRRPLAAATAEILCFRAALPLDASNALLGATTTVTLAFDASFTAAAP